jgi:tetratricopeptide (TPR) repeat protein
VTFVDDLGLRAAATLETSVGPYLALAAYRRLFTAGGPTRERAIQGALRCALALSDEGAVRECCDEWRKIEASPATLAQVVAELLRGGRTHVAKLLADADAARTSTARATYLVARATDALGTGGQRDGAPSGNLEAWWAVVSAARRAGDASGKQVLALAAARHAGLALAQAARDETYRLPRARLAESCEAADDDALPPALEARLPLLRGKLLSPSKFQRAAALSRLEVLARGGPDTSVGRQALFAVLRHADSLPTRLDPIELDRIRACVKHLPYPPIREATLRAIEEVSASPPAASSAPTSAELDAARARLEDAIPKLTPHAAPPVGLPVAALHLLRAGRDTAVAARFLDAQLARTTTLPPGPLLAVARLLQTRGHFAEAESYLEEALRFRERDAKLARGDALRRRAYSAIEQGDRALAQSLLAEARSLMTPEAC